MSNCKQIILDPIADKLTQGILAFCLIERYEWMIALFILFLIKESYMGIAELIVLKKGDSNDGARWYGEITTALLYGVMIILILLPGIPDIIANILIVICFCMMSFSLIMYIRLYNKILRDAK